MQTVPLIRPPQSKSLKSSRVTLAPGEEVGEHVTNGREEIIIVLKGSGTLVRGGEKSAIMAGEAYFIGEGVTHNIKNESRGALEYLYVVAMLR